MIARLFLVLMVVSIFSCTNKAPEQHTPAQPIPQTPPATSATVLPLYPLDKATDLFNNCDYVDLTFNPLQFSVNFNQPKEAKRIIAGFLSNNLPPNMNCANPFGFVSFLGKGEVLAEADIFFETGCTYLIFRENNQYAYTCAMPNQGIQFINQMVKTQQESNRLQGQ